MKKAIIIGGGVAGLSAGIYLSQGGVECHIYEKHFLAGGNLTGWNRKGHHIDNCIHWLTGTNSQSDFYKWWENVGALGDGLVIQPDTLYTSELNGETISFYRDSNKTKREMLALSPQDSKEIEKFFRAIDEMKKAEGYYPADEKGRVPKKRFALRMIGLMFKYHNLSLFEFGQKFKHPLLAKCFGDYIMSDFSLLALIYTYANFAGDNAGLPVGGSFEMAQRMTKRFEALGGTVHYSAPVREIVCTKGKSSGVILEDGGFVSGDYVICSCDPKITFEKLLHTEVPRAYFDARPNKKQLVYSSMHCAFSIKGDLPFEGSYVIDGNNNGFKNDRIVLREYSHESGFAPKGGAVMQSLVYLHEDDCNKWIELRNTNRAEYIAMKKELAEGTLNVILSRFPELSGKIELIDVWTPATYNRYFGSRSGAWMTCALIPHKLPKVQSSKIKKLKNVYMATQWQMSPGGVPVALTFGKQVAEIILKGKGHQKPAPSVGLVEGVKKPEPATAEKTK